MIIESKNILEKYDNKIFYKYLDIDGGIKMLDNKTLKFSMPSEFNDPYDIYEGLLDFNNVNYFGEEVFEKHKNRLNRKQRRIYKSRSNRETENILRNAVSVLKNNIGICCLSEINDEILMWSHYSKKHTGICIGIEIDIKEFAKNKIFFFPVNYVVKYESKYFGSDKNERDKSLIYWTKTKYLKWKYEKEVRLIDFEYFNHHKSGLYNIEKSKIKEVYFGTNIDKDKKKKIIKIINSFDTKPAYYQMELKNDEFSLTRK
ncbi:DUF2971 domain-containing protein [Bacteroidota bacterium]